MMLNSKPRKRRKETAEATQQAEQYWEKHKTKSFRCVKDLAGFSYRSQSQQAARSQATPAEALMASWRVRMSHGFSPELFSKTILSLVPETPLLEHVPQVPWVWYWWPRPLFYDICHYYPSCYLTISPGLPRHLHYIIQPLKFWLFRVVPSNQGLGTIKFISLPILCYGGERDRYWTGMLGLA